MCEIWMCVVYTHRVTHTYTVWNHTMWIIITRNHRCLYSPLCAEFYTFLSNSPSFQLHSTPVKDCQLLLLLLFFFFFDRSNTTNFLQRGWPIYYLLFQTITSYVTVRKVFLKSVKERNKKNSLLKLWLELQLFGLATQTIWLGKPW